MRADYMSLTRLAGLYVYASAVGWLAAKLQLPLPYMIGPLLAVAAFMLISGSDMAVPATIRPPAQATVAVHVGMYFSPLALAATLSELPLILTMTLVSLLVAFCAGWVLSRVSHLPLSTSMIATLPTSPVEAAVIAREHGFSLPPVVLTQTLRVAGVVVLVPLAIRFIEGAGTARTGYVTASGLPDYAVLGLLALAAWGAATLFTRLRISNPKFIGPLALSATLAACGLQLPRIPPEILHAAQVVLGVWLGGNFRRTVFRGGGRLFLSAVFSTVVFVGLCVAGGLTASAVTGMDWRAMVLASVPGGVTEMALTASSLQQNVPLITSFHLVRIFLLVPMVPLMITLLHRLEDRRSG